MASIFAILGDNQFVLSILPNHNVFDNSIFILISRIKVGQNTLVIFKKPVAENKAIGFVTVTDNYSWISQIPTQLEKYDQVTIVSEKANFGLHG